MCYQTEAGAVRGGCAMCEMYNYQKRCQEQTAEGNLCEFAETCENYAVDGDTCNKNPSDYCGVYREKISEKKIQEMTVNA
jgi:hypothetical protein